MILINGCSFTAGDENWPIGFEMEGYSLFDNKKSADPFDVYNAACGGSGNNDSEKEDKIIRNIAKNVTIDKK